MTNHMKNIIRRIIFRARRPTVVFVCGRACFSAVKVIEKTLGSRFKIKKIVNGKLPFFWGRDDILVCEDSLINKVDYNQVGFFVKNSSPFIFVVTNFGEVSSDKDYFEGKEEDVSRIKEIVKSMPSSAFLILNFDDGNVRRLRNETESKVLSFGFIEGSNFQVTDLKIDESGTNFKVNCLGSTVPFWLEKKFGKEQIYDALAAVCVGDAKSLNLVEVSQSLSFVDNA